MAKKSGPGNSSRRGRSAKGRANVKGSGRAQSTVGRYVNAEDGGRYTPPIPKEQKVSPRWFGPTILTLLILGVLVILMNYLGAFGQPSGWLLLAGLGIIAAGFAMATRFR
jgi:hypothetical protein